jgi:hypothetical protein
MASRKVCSKSAVSSLRAKRAPTTTRLWSSIYVELHIARLMWSTWLCGVVALKPKRPLDSGASDST